MRFVENGPALPDELLVARDEGHVLFFCGAGVSRARANLPSFLALAEQVLDRLKALPDSDAYRLFRAARELQEKSGVSGLLAADRIFSLLENDFPSPDIERIVGSLLTPDQNVDLSAHKIMLELSRNAAGQVRLITTNFDRLFLDADSGVQLSTPDSLPDLSRIDGVDGIVHLHGVFEKGYRRSTGGRLILSSAEFGRAYLAEGWAARFIRDAIAKYIIVFVGYSADDPPVQYLLEALSRGSNNRRGLFAFQDGRDDVVKARWAQKGVTAFSYPADNGHCALWDTLGGWAERARDPARWRSTVIRQALKGPETLKPHERGQVVHLAMTTDGSRALAESKKPIPSTWLCVFDPAVRYGTPGPQALFRSDLPEFDPFALYGIDADLVPPPRDRSDPFKRREAPRDALDVFSPTSFDHIGAQRGGFRSSETELPLRLVSLAIWLRKVGGQPAAIWWAAGQRTLHPRVLGLLEFLVSHSNRSVTAAARSAWRYVLSCRRDPNGLENLRLHDLQQQVAKDGWTSLAWQAYETLGRPELTVERPWGAGPPTRVDRLTDVIRLDVKYTDQLSSIQIPETAIPHAVAILRRNLDVGDMLENEVNPYFRDGVSSLVSDVAGRVSSHVEGFNKRIVEFTNEFERFLRIDRVAARNEVNSWPRTSKAFDRLRIWAAGLDGLWDDETAGDVLIGISEEVFWNGHAQRDLLLVLERRWSALPEAGRNAIEHRLLKGRPKWSKEDRRDYLKRRNGLTLERLQWLQESGCKLSARTERELKRLEGLTPEWTKEQSARAIEDMSPRAGYVVTDEDHNEFVDTPVSQLIERVLAARHREAAFFRERDPYGGLCKDKPVRVLSALKHVQDLEKSQIAWTRFLQSGERLNDRRRLCTLIARRLVLLPERALAQICRPVASWLARTAGKLFAYDIDGAYTLFDRLSALLTQHQSMELSDSVVLNEEKWLERAWNSVAGDLISALLEDPGLSDLSHRGGLPSAWKQRAEAVLALRPENNRFAIVRFGSVLSWLFWCDDEWTDQHVLTALTRDSADKEAFIAGLFSHPSISGEQLFSRLKPLFFELAEQNSVTLKGYTQPLSGILCSGWLLKKEDGSRWITDEEFRVVLVRCSTEMRGSILWQVTKWEKFEDKFYFIHDVWPLQLVARGPTVSNRLCEVAVSDEEHFPQLAAAILPKLTVVEDGMLYSLAHGNGTKLITRYPHSVLDLMDAILPMSAAKWPYTNPH
ncbi:MAG TPA: SIR2 family protein [Methylosinus sp.]|jgi:hypothetical protein|uniref:SIR2 family protein n=1 Tax=Methylosinus sp. TaxID=427 RepID=UPI002F93CD33